MDVTTNAENQTLNYLIKGGFYDGRVAWVHLHDKDGWNATINGKARPTSAKPWNYRAINPDAESSAEKPSFVSKSEALAALETLVMDNLGYLDPLSEKALLYRSGPLKNQGLDTNSMYAEQHRLGLKAKEEREAAKLQPALDKQN